MAIRVQQKKFFGTEPESLEAVNAAFSRYRELGKTNIALNNLFVFDDTIQRGLESPLFALRGDFPFPELSVITYPNGNKFYKLPDKLNIDTFSIEMYETASAVVWDYYESWQSKVFHENGTYNLPRGDNGFKRDLIVYRFDRYFNRVFGYRYIGVFPTSISPYTPSADDPNVVTSTITFSVDDAKRLKNFGSETSMSMLDSSIKSPFRPDPDDAWSTVKSEADSEIAANRSEMEQNRSLQEKIYANANLRKDIRDSLAAAGLPEAGNSAVANTINRGAFSLFYSRG